MSLNNWCPFFLVVFAISTLYVLFRLFAAVRLLRVREEIIEISSRMAASGLSAGGPKADAYRAGFARSDIVATVCDKLYTPLFKGLFGERFPTIRYQYDFMMARMIVHLKQMGDSGVAIEMSETYYGKKYDIRIMAEAPLTEKLVRSIVEEYPGIFQELYYFSTGVYNDPRDGSVILEGAVLPPSAAALVEHMTAPGFEEHIKALYAKVEVEQKRERDEYERARRAREQAHVASGGAGASSAPAPESAYKALKEALRKTVSPDGTVVIVGNEFLDATPPKIPHLVVSVQKPGEDLLKRTPYIIRRHDFSIKEFEGLPYDKPERFAFLEAIVSDFRPPANNRGRRSSRKQRKSRRTNRKRSSRTRTH